MTAPERVTAIEAAFLDIERPGLPLHVGALLVLAGDRPVTLVDMHKLLHERIARLPRFRELAVGREWVRTRIDMRRHLLYHRLAAPGTDAQLLELSAHIHELELPRDRPLWQVHLIDGLHGGGQAIIVKTHHAITDGVAGVEVAETLFDRHGASPHRLEPPRTTFGEHARPSALLPLQTLLGVAMTAAGGPIALDGPFNGHVGPRRDFAVAEIPLHVVREVKSRFGGTVDDVVVAMVAAGLRDYLRDVRYPDAPRALRAMLPVSTCSTRPGGFGNHVSAIFLDLPMDVEDLGAIVQAVAARKSVLRSAHAAAGVELLVEATGLLPGPFHLALMRFAGGVRGFNLVLSDIPAPDEPLFLLGRRIVASYPMMPLGGDSGLSIAVLGMAGKLCAGITTDPELVPSARRIAGAISSALNGFTANRLARTA